MISMPSFWKTFPRKSVIVFLAGVFLTFSTVGIASDLIEMGRQPALLYILMVLISGVFTSIYAAVGIILRRQMWKAFVPIFALHMLLLNLLHYWLPSFPPLVVLNAADVAHLQSRLTFDARCMLIAIALGYSCFVYVFVSEGRRYFRVHAEMELAAEIHHVLVPPIDMKIGEFEFYGRSVPSGEVGGDLIDVFQDSTGWIAYVADVSGHGIAPGVVMAMVKSAARMQISSGEKSSELLGRLNSVLLPIKKPDMFATFAYLAWDGARLEYSLAGHPAILHYQAATNEISEVSCLNMPLGMFDQQTFDTASVHCAPNDLFLILTDGLLEVTNAKGEEFTLSGIRPVMLAHVAAPLDAIFQSIVDAVHHHGHAADDQSMLLVRCHRIA
jgi:Stage II sporulation protein E (SpoIIE)